MDPTHSVSIPRRALCSAKPPAKRFKSRTNTFPYPEGLYAQLNSSNKVWHVGNCMKFPYPEGLYAQLNYRRHPPSQSSPSTFPYPEGLYAQLNGPTIIPSPAIKSYQDLSTDEHWIFSPSFVRALTVARFAQDARLALYGGKWRKRLRGRRSSLFFNIL